MSKKMIRDIAIAILVIFVVTIIVYPLIFGTDPQSPAEPPVELEISK